MWWLLLACVADPDPDLDHDGLPVSLDCDDGNAAVLGVQTWFRDADLDGFGGDVVITHCTAPTGMVPKGGDCDDANPLVNRSVDEVCNGRDDDCDGEVDEQARGAGPWYADADRDGFGEAESKVRSCDPVPGHVRESGDCDDGDGRAWPGAFEICGDGHDQDCDGHDGSCWLGGEVSARAADATFHGDRQWSYTGASVDGAGDVNGDGYDDIVVGAYGWAAPPGLGPGQTGGAFVWHGPVAGAEALIDADAVYVGLGVGDANGWRVVGVGDVDGDGRDEAAVSAPYLDHEGEREAGAVAIVGGEQGVLSIGGAPMMIGPEPYAYLGIALGGAGDWNGDGRPDLVVADVAESWFVRVMTGGYDGGPRAGEDAWLHIDTGRLGAQGFTALTGVGDVDGDGLPELAVAPTDSFQAGSVWLVSAPLDGAVALEDAGLLVQVGAHGDELGASLDAAGDVDGDGYGDLVVGAPGRDGERGDGGGAALYLGPIAEPGHEPAAWWMGEAPRDRAGVAVAGVGDADGDGRDDLLVGASDHGSTAPGAGAAYVLLEPGEGTYALDRAELTVLGGGTSAGLGRAVGAAGDVNADGYADVLIGAPGADGPSGRHMGASYLFLGAPR